jgi:uncharacterized protein YjiS (DUF1127 family)
MSNLVIHSRPDARAVLATSIKTLLGRYAAFRQRRSAAAELRSVDPRILKDMAIDRSEIDSIVYCKESDRKRGYTGGSR